MTSQDGFGGPGGPPDPTVPAQGEPEEEPTVRFRDNRRIDPETFQARPTAEPTPPAAEQTPPEQPTDSPTAEGVAKLAELTADLQRVTAEYANYRKRVDRDRELQRDLAVAEVLNSLLPALDDAARAREHGELDGAFKAVAETLDQSASKYGLETYGAEGELFDPTVHEAMTSDTSPDVTEPTVTKVYQVGYRIKDRVLRPARVGVSDAE